MEGNKVLLPALGALLAAIAGGGAWALITVLSNYELGIIAWGIAGLTSYVVVYLANRQTSLVHQIITVIGSLLGILLGKYFTFAYLLHEDFTHFFDSQTISLFQSDLRDTSGIIDIVFVALAVYTAWTMPIRMAAANRGNGPGTNSGPGTVVEPAPTEIR